MTGREFAWLRDVPRSCICHWHWLAPGARYVLAAAVDGCPWHTRRRT